MKKLLPFLLTTVILFTACQNNETRASTLPEQLKPREMYVRWNLPEEDYSEHYSLTYDGYDGKKGYLGDGDLSYFKRNDVFDIFQN
ncbi:MAG: hypothetical protein FWD34_07775 [Oscillospiraceae bacterium]|nr:hypothetical protein [Oscillospiraceae bacterium]